MSYEYFFIHNQQTNHAQENLTCLTELKPFAQKKTRCKLHFNRNQIAYLSS